MTTLKDAWKFRSKKLHTVHNVQIDGTLTVAGVSASAPSILLPEDNNFAGWNYHPAGVATTLAPVAGTIYLNKVPLRRVSSVTKVWWLQGTAAITPTGGQSFAALVGPDGTVLSSSGIDTQMANTNAPQSATLAVAQNNLAPGNYYVALLFNAATPPVLYRTNAPFAANLSANQSASQLNHAINGTAATALPASFTLGSNTSGNSIWAGVS